MGILDFHVHVVMLGSRWWRLDLLLKFEFLEEDLIIISLAWWDDMTGHRYLFVCSLFSVFLQSKEIVWISFDVKLLDLFFTIVLDIIFLLCLLV